MSRIKVFITYSHKNMDFADEIAAIISKLPVAVERDERKVFYRDSFKSFMKKIRKCDYSIMIISDEYLKSDACMYEVNEFIKDDNYKEKLLPVVLDFSLLEKEKALYYIQYWYEEYKSLERKIERVDRTFTVASTKELKDIRHILENIDEFLANIRDMKHAPYEKLKQNKFKDLINVLNKHINISQNNSVIMLNDSIEHDVNAWTPVECIIMPETLTDIENRILIAYYEMYFEEGPKVKKNMFALNEKDQQMQNYEFVSYIIRIEMQDYLDASKNKQPAGRISNKYNHNYKILWPEQVKITSKGINYVRRLKRNS